MLTSPLQSTHAAQLNIRGTQDRAYEASKSRLITFPCIL